MKKVLFGFVVVSALFAVSAFAAPDTLRFHPPDSLVYTSTTLSTKIADINGKIMNDTTSTKARCTLKKMPYGYSLKFEPLEVRVSRDGQVVNNPVVALMSKIGYTYVLDSTGMATTVSGFEDIYHRIDSSLDSTSAAAIKRMVTPDAMSAQTIAEWNGRMEMLVNRPFSVKDITYDKTEYTLPTQQKIPMYGGTMISDTLSIGGVPCVKVRIVYTSSPDTLARLLELKRTDVIAHFMVSDSTLKSIPSQPAQIISDITLIAEKKSLLLRQEESRRDATLSISGQGPTPQKMSSHETRSTKTTY